MVINNRPGAGGSVGAALVAKAAPDGHTLAMVSSSFTTNAAIEPKLPFDLVGSFSAAALVGKGPLVLAVGSAVNAKTPAKFRVLARSNPGRLNYATSGSGSINHFATELFQATAGVKLTHVPYNGMGPAVNDPVGGHVALELPTLARLNAEINAALMTEEMTLFLLREGAESAPLSPGAFSGLVRSEIARWRKVAKEANIQSE